MRQLMHEHGFHVQMRQLMHERGQHFREGEERVIVPQPQVDSDGLSALSCALVSAKSVFKRLLASSLSARCYFRFFLYNIIFTWW